MKKGKNGRNYGTKSLRIGKKIKEIKKIKKSEKWRKSEKNKKVKKNKNLLGNRKRVFSSVFSGGWKSLTLFQRTPTPCYKNDNGRRIKIMKMIIIFGKNTLPFFLDLPVFSGEGIRDFSPPPCYKNRSLGTRSFA